MDVAVLSWVMNLGFAATGTADAPVLPSADKTGRLVLIMAGLLALAGAVA